MQWTAEDVSNAAPQEVTDAMHGGKLKDDQGVGDGWKNGRPPSWQWKGAVSPEQEADMRRVNERKWNRWRSAAGYSGDAA